MTAFVLAAALLAADGPAKGVKKVEAVFDPVEAKPGQTVTLKITVTLEDGFHTYPTKQPEKAAAGFVNKLTMPDNGTLIFVGDTIEPADPETKAEPELGIKELQMYGGTLTYERKAVVSPKAATGDATVTVKALKLTVCDKDNCFPPKTLTPAATLKVAGTAVAVEKQFADEVSKALSGK